jgi:dipeptide/tripeptide permease
MSQPPPDPTITTPQNPPPPPEGFFQRVIAYISGHPKGFWFFFWGELAERCSYYGMNAILLLYLVDTLKIARDNASVWTYWFMAATYLTPLFGGFIADRYFGKYWTIVGFAIPYVIGNALLVIYIGPEDVIRMESGFAIPPVLLLVALVILAFGSGVIKPNISTLMGMTYDQQRPGQDALRSAAFVMFYWAINIGSAISQTAMPRIRDFYGPNMAFLLPTILMAIALVIFALGRRFYAVETIQHVQKTPEERREQWQVLARLLGVFILATVFWSTFKHYSVVWVLFTRDKLDTTIFGTTYEADQFQPLNSYILLTLLPIAAWLFAYLAKRGIHLRPTDKMQIGFFFTALTPCIFILADNVAGTGKTHIGFLVLAYLCITIAEILISPVGLELAFVAAPKSMKGFITACFLFTIFMGTIINSGVTPYYSKEVDGVRLMTPTQYFSVQAAVCAVAFVLFYFIAKPFNRRLDAQRAGA